MKPALTWQTTRKKLIQPNQSNQRSNTDVTTFHSGNHPLLDTSVINPARNNNRIIEASSTAC
jgi:hypothetical protein